MGSPEKIINNENKGSDCTIDGFLLLILHDSKKLLVFLPTPPPRGAWVFRWTFFLPLLPPLSHLQSFVSLRYRTFLLGTENAVGGGRGSLAVYAILFIKDTKDCPRNGNMAWQI